LVRSEDCKQSVVNGLELIPIEGGRIAYVMKDDKSISLEQFKYHYRDNIQQFLQVAIQTTKAFANMHNQNVLHLDIKPQNVLISPKDETVKLMDFGVSQVVSLKQPFIPFSGNPVGTYAYMSPEATGRFSRHIDARADIYSTGMTLYKMLHGEPAFSGQGIELVHAHIAKNPVPLHELHDTVPRALSDIVQKCLEKNPDERFSSMAALNRALQHCFNFLKEGKSLEDFDVNTFSDVGVFSIPEKLYGREAELDQLEASLLQTRSGEPALYMIGGYSGSGKTALVGELNRRLVGKGFRGIFASGKFDQFQNQPYAAIIQIVQQLVLSMSLMETAEMEAFKDQINSVLDGKGALLTKVVPALEHIIGEQPEVEPLARATEAEQRFISTLVSFLSAFGSREEILLLFVDDLQWCDTASLSVLKEIIQLRGTQIFAVGAYRDNEVDDAHPLVHAIAAIRDEDLRVDQITLKSLSQGDICNLISDTLRVSPETVQSLTDEVYNKTQGNAFFSREFLLNLYSEKFIRYSIEENKWTWDIEEIRSQHFSANVVDFMVKNIVKFDKEVQRLLQIAACIGNKFKLQDLSLAAELDVERTQELLWSPIQEGWIQQKNTTFKWQHDRLQQASSVLMDNDALQRTHLQLARQLLKNARETDNLRQELFEIVNHYALVKDKELITDADELKQIRTLYMTAADYAIEASAFEPALNYATISVALLGENPWQDEYDVAFKANFLLARAYFFNSDYQKSEEVYKSVLDSCKTKIEKLRVLDSLNEMFYVTSQFDKSYTLMMTMYELSNLFSEVPREDPALIMEYIQKKYAELLQIIEEFGDLSKLSSMKEVTDEEVSLTNALATGCTAAVFLASNSQPLHFFTMALVMLESSLKYGKELYTSTSLALASWVFQLFFKNVEIGLILAEQGEEIAHQYKNPVYIGRINLFRAQINQYNPDLEYASKKGRELCDKAFMILNKCGDYSFAGFAIQHGTTRFARFGSDLTKQLERHQRCVAFYRKTKWVNTEDLDSSTMSFIKVVAGIDKEYAPKYIQEKFTEARLSRMHHHYYHAWTLYMQRSYGEAFAAASKAQEFVADAFGLPQFNDFFLLMPLILAQLYSDDLPDEKKAEIMGGIETCKGQIDDFDSFAVVFFKAYKALLEAEILRLKEPNNFAGIVNAYDEAVFLGDKAGQFWITGLANELCAEYIIKSGLENDRIVGSYMQSAMSVWNSIGAQLKAKQLLDMFPKYVTVQLSVKTSSATVGGATVSRDRTSPLTSSNSPSTASADHGTTTAIGNGLDTATIIKATSALSSEMNLSKLLSQLMEIVMENAGATFGALVLKSHDCPFIEARSGGDTERIPVLTGAHNPECGLSEKVVYSVLRTRVQINVSNAQKDATLRVDPHVKDARVLSLLCTPITHKGDVLGVLYLENSKIEGVFHQSRTSMINHLLSSVSANVENARMVKNIMDLNSSYARFLPKQFLELLEKGDVRNICTGDSVTRHCCVSFLDIRNFTGITEKLTSEGSMKFVNQFLEYLCPEIDNNDGFIDKFIGDAVMSLFPNSVVSGLKGVTGMIHALERLNADHYVGKDPLRIGIGLHYGRLQLGTVGYANRLDATCIGDTVNTASRLEGLTKGFGANVIVSQEFYNRLIEENGSVEIDTIKFCNLGDFILKGRTAPSSLYEVYDTTWTDDASPREELPHILELFKAQKFEECEHLCAQLANEYTANNYILRFYQDACGMYKEYIIGDDWNKAIPLTKDGTPKPLDFPLKGDTEGSSESSQRSILLRQSSRSSNARREEAEATDADAPEQESTLSSNERDELERYRRIYGKMSSKRKASNYVIQWNSSEKRYEKVDVMKNADSMLPDTSKTE